MKLWWLIRHDNNFWVGTIFSPWHQICRPDRTVTDHAGQNHFFKELKVQWVTVYRTPLTCNVFYFFFKSAISNVTNDNYSVFWFKSVNINTFLRYFCNREPHRPIYTTFHCFVVKTREPVVPNPERFQFCFFFTVNRTILKNGSFQLYWR